MTTRQRELKSRKYAIIDVWNVVCNTEHFTSESSAIQRFRARKPQNPGLQLVRSADGAKFNAKLSCFESEE